MPIANYNVTGTNRLKTWKLMTKPALETLIYNNNEICWSFHETFLNYIDNIDWQDIMTHTINTVDKDFLTQLGEVPITVIEQYCTTVE